MGQFSELWSYCKETFGIIKRRLFVFVPRLLLLGLFLSLITLMIATAFLRLLPVRGVLGLPPAIVLMSVLFLVANLIVESGQINIFAKSALGYSVGMEDFREGVRRFTGRVFAGGFIFILLFLLIGLSALVFIAIPLLNILAVVAIVIAMLALNVFLSAWKAAVVFKDLGVMEAFEDSYRFVKEFFWPMALVAIVRGFFDGNNNNGRQGDSHGSNLNAGRVNFNIKLPGSDMFGMDTGSMLGVGSVMALLVIIPMAAIAAIISIAITTYIDQLVFVIYARRQNLG